ncbi:antibiotic biosynthesis monooxygenase [Puteibacter caeruleilacunae]|nr:antibiotic biosynthesis monooxygenase [Puteibacter caeruleilacunae]
MIIVTVKSAPIEGRKEDFLKEFNAITETVRQENGCIEYEIYQKDEQSNILFIFEKWESQEALDAHLATPHMKAFFEKVTPWFDNENDMSVYEVK